MRVIDVVLIGLWGTAPLAAQRLPKPEFNRNPTVLVAPTSVSTYRPSIIPTPYLQIQFAPVPSAVEYRVSRSAEGGPETVIFQSAVSAFVTPGFTCKVGDRIPYNRCTYNDQSVKPLVVYTYWIRTIYSGDVASPPSHPATAHRTQQ